MQQQPVLSEKSAKPPAVNKKLGAREKKINQAIALVEKLAGSVPIPKEWKGKNIDQIIEDSKNEYFNKKYGKFLKDK